MGEYGACGAGEEADQGASRRAPAWPPLRLALGSTLAVGVCCVVASVGMWGGRAGRAVLAQGRGQALTEKLSEYVTSARTDLAHPYGSMYPAYPKFYNPSGQPPQAVNPQPQHPYHHGQRPQVVQNEDFEHNPYGNKLPWDSLPEGAQAKYEKRPDKMKAYRYMVNNDGVVVRWDENLKKRDVDPRYIGPATLKHLSPVPEPQPSATDVADALLHMQRQRVRRSFRNVLPTGAFHDSIVDAQSGMELDVPDIKYHEPEVRCPAGLMKCPDKSCVASMSYCPGCEDRPMPQFCTANAAQPSGWRASMIGCNKKEVGDCGMKNGQGLYLPGESVSSGYITGGLGR